MLTISGFGAVSDDFVDCMAEHNDLEMCRELYPATEGPVPLTVAEQQVAASRACDFCNPDTQWCDGTQCIEFTAEERAQWTEAGKPPAQLVVAATPVKQLIKGVPNKTLAIVAAIGVLGFIVLRRKRAAPTTTSAAA